MRKVGGTMVIALLLGLSACGGEDELSATEFRDRANGICRDLMEENERAFDGLDANDRAAVAKASEEVGRRTEDALDDLEALSGPESSEAGVDRFLAAADEFQEIVERRNEAATSRDEDAIAKSDAEIDRQNERVQQVARDAGLTACAA